MKSAVTSFISGFIDVGHVDAASAVSSAPSSQIPAAVAAAELPLAPPVQHVIEKVPVITPAAVPAVQAVVSVAVDVPEKGWVAAAKLQVVAPAPVVEWPDRDALEALYKQMKHHLAADRLVYDAFMKAWADYFEGKRPISEVILHGERACGTNLKLVAKFRKMLPLKLQEDFDFYRKVHALSEVAFRFPTSLAKIEKLGADLDAKKLGIPEYVRTIGAHFAAYEDMRRLFRDTLPPGYRRADIYEWAATMPADGTPPPGADDVYPPFVPGKSYVSNVTDDIATGITDPSARAVIAHLRDELDEANDLADRNYQAWQDNEEDLKKRKDESKKIKELTETLRLRDELIKRMEARLVTAKTEGVEEAVRARADQLAASKVRALEITNDILDKQVVSYEKKLKGLQASLDNATNARKSRDAEFNALLAVKDRLKAENERYLTELDRYAEAAELAQSEKKKGTNKTLVVVQTSEHANLKTANKNLTEAVKRIRDIADAERKRCEDIIADRETIKKRASTSDGKVAAAEARVSDAVARLKGLEEEVAAKAAESEGRRKEVERLERELSSFRSIGAAAKFEAKAEAKEKAKAAKAETKLLSSPPSPASSASSASSSPVKTLSRDEECTTCMEVAFDSMLVPCAHSSYCSACAASHVGKPCPVCRTMVEGFFLNKVEA